MKLFKLLFALTLMLMIYTSPVSAQYSYQVVSYPGSVVTDVFGVNNAGKVVGNTSFTGLSGEYFGFVYDSKKGTYTPVPELDGVLGINKSGVMVGRVVDDSGFSACAIRDKKGVVTLFYPPSFDDVVDPDFDGCRARAVNSSGKVTGFVVSNAGADWIGFVHDPKKGTFEEFLPSSRTIAQGINSKGEIVGSVRLDAGAAYPGSPPGRYGFLRKKDDSFKYFTVNESLATNARGISDSGNISGFFGDPITAEIRAYAMKLSKAPGFENIDLAPGQILMPETCNLVMPLPPADYTRFTDVFGQAIRNDGVVAGFCWTTDVKFNPPGDINGAILDIVAYGGNGYIATPECAGSGKKKCN